MNIEIPVRRSRIPIALFIGILIFSIALFLYIQDDGALPFFYYRAFYIVLMFYGGVGAVIALLDYIKTVFDKKARLVLSQETFDDNLSILSCGPIAWEELSGVSIKKLKWYKAFFLVVTLADNEKYLKNKNPVIRYILKRHIRLYGGIIVISDRRIAYDIQKLRQDILDRGIRSHHEPML
jgi:hypothetical protein